MSETLARYSAWLITSCRMLLMGIPVRFRVQQSVRAHATVFLRMIRIDGGLSRGLGPGMVVHCALMLAITGILQFMHFTSASHTARM